MVFPGLMYGCENGIIKKAQHWRTDAFELWCWRRLLRVLRQQGDKTSPSKQKSTLSIHWKDWCWSWSSSTLATWCKKLTHWKRPWCWERMKAKGKGSGREWDGYSITDSVDMNLSKLQKVWKNKLQKICPNSLKDRGAWCTVVHGVTKSRTWLSDSTAKPVYNIFELSPQSYKQEYWVD